MDVKNIEASKGGARKVVSRVARVAAIKKADIAELLRLMMTNHASDLHLKVGSSPIMRINGRLAAHTLQPPMTEEDIERAFATMTSEEQREVFAEELELDFAYEVENSGRFRVNAHMQGGKLGLVLRMVPWEIPSIDDLGLPEACKALVMHRAGLVAVTGPTGSGKSTTLAAMINYLNQNEARKVVTVEDPIEFVHRDINCVFCQRELGLDTKSFAKGLRAALRQDLNVILVGEMRDGDTAAAALTAAETGHLVLTTLQTAGAARAVERIIDMFPAHQQQQARVQLSMSLQGVLYQTLVPSADGKGRVPAVEVLLANAAVRNLIREGKTFQIPSIMQTAAQAGMQSLDIALFELCRDGTISLEEAASRCENPQEMRAKLTQLPRAQRPARI
jgi:twitching motility protein PilT